MVAGVSQHGATALNPPVLRFMNKPEYAPLSAILLEFGVKTPYASALHEGKQFIHMIGVHLYF